MTRYCNFYGAEREVTRPYAGITGGTVLTRAECHAPWQYRVVWRCSNGHTGPVIQVCEQHFAEGNGHNRATYEGMEGVNRELNGRTMPVPWNMRRAVQVCGGCVSQSPDCDNPEHQAMMRGRPGRCGCREIKPDRMWMERVS
jgi:hypothetical protein